MSTTGTKKELIDFLWEWAESCGDWGKLLVSKIIECETRLSEDERKLIFDYFLQSIKLNTGLPKIDLPKPVYNPTTKTVSLIKLAEVNGVNKLAAGQSLNFAKNLTIIYGEN